MTPLSQSKRNRQAVRMPLRISHPGIQTHVPPDSAVHQPPASQGSDNPGELTTKPSRLNREIAQKCWSEEAKEQKIHHRQGPLALLQGGNRLVRNVPPTTPSDEALNLIGVDERTVIRQQCG